MVEWFIVVLINSSAINSNEILLDISYKIVMFLLSLVCTRDNIWEEGPSA